MFRNRAFEAGKQMLGFVKIHAGKIAYYGSVAAALCAIAFAAEQYRTERHVETEALVLPPAEIEVSAPAQENIPLEIPLAKLVRGYSVQPEWNAALGQWENHMAVDYSFDGNQVVSVCDGVVLCVGESSVHGGFIEIEAGEYLLRYASLNAAEEIEPGREISRGDLLGYADDSMPGEMHMDVHLHLELYKAGESMDFEAEARKKQDGGD